MSNNAPYFLDRFDHAILAQLQDDGRIPNQELAERIGLTASPCLRRTKRLEQSGVIERYVALVDPVKVGLAVNAFVRVRLDSQDDSTLTTFEATIGDFPEVMQCYLMTGDADYQLLVLVRSLAEFEEFLRFRLTKVPGVEQVTTGFALRSVVSRTRLPV